MTDTEIRRIKATVPVWRGGLARRKRERLERLAAQMRERYLANGSGCRSTARAIEQRTGRTA